VASNLTLLRQTSVYALNTRSILHPLHSVAFSDLVDLHKPDLVCLSETWIIPITISTELKNCTPPGYNFISTLCNFTKNTSLSLLLTAVANYWLPFPWTFHSAATFRSILFFLWIIVSYLKLPHSNLSVFNIYRPPSSSTYFKPSSVFLDKFSFFLFSAATTPREFLITGDFNIHPNNTWDNVTSKFLTLLISIC